MVLGVIDVSITPLTDSQRLISYCAPNMSIFYGNMEKLHLLLLLGNLCVQSTGRSNCYQEMNYEKLYGYKYDINCNHLDESNLKELQGTIVNTKVKLTITDSNLSTITSKFFKNVPNTKQLVINSSIVSLDNRIFTHLEFLDALVLNNNSIGKLAEGFLDGPKNIRVLKLTRNKLTDLPNNTFLETNLKELDLSINHFTDFTIPCELNQLTVLYLTRNQLANLENFLFECLPLLQDLNLSQNKIARLRSFKTLRYLQKLDLSYNLLEDVHEFIAHMENLKHLNLEGNLLTTVSASSFQNVTYLTSLNLANNYLTVLSLPNFKYLDTLDLEINKLDKVPLLNVTSLTKLRLSHNALALDENVVRFSQLIELRLSHCSVGEIKNRINNLKSLEVVDLSYSNVTLQEVSFLNLHRLREINLSGNWLSSLRRLRLINLEILNLSRNALKVLETDVFHNCKKITVLDLSYNQLEVLNRDLLTSLESLVELHVENNKLKYLSYGGIVSKLKNLRLFNIQENVFSCQFLSAMAYYFTAHHVEFGSKEHIGDYGENVAGIHCQEDKSTDGEQDDSQNNSDNTFVLIIVSVTLVLLCLITFLLYKILSYLRKRTVVDEIELLEKRLKLKSLL